LQEIVRPGMNMQAFTTVPLSAPFVAAPRRRRLRTLVRATAAVGVFTMLAMPERPESVIGGDLAAGASALNGLPADATRDAIRRTLESSFPGRAVSVDAGRFPAAVDVTLQGVDRPTCVSAEASARRIEGKVVIELQGYPSPAACRAANDMTWRFLP
jgi:hypothetical protein